jgi:hypothetical protein
MAEMGVAPKDKDSASAGSPDTSTSITNSKRLSSEAGLYEGPRGRTMSRASHTSRPTEHSPVLHPMPKDATQDADHLIWDSDVKVEITPEPETPQDVPVSRDESLAVLKGLAKSPVYKPLKLNAGMFGEHGITRQENVKSSIDLGRRRPWLVKELEAFLEKGGSKVDVKAPQKDDDDADGEGGEKQVFDSAVEVQVIDSETEESALGGGQKPERSALTRNENKENFEPDTPASQRFPSANFPRITTNPFSDPPDRQPSTVSTLTSADADDESSLHTRTPFQPTNTSTANEGDSSLIANAVDSPNVTRRPLRPRSHTKAMRRRGMDIARSSFALRISSRWTSGERDALKGFKDDLMGRAGRIKVDESVKEEGIDVDAWKREQLMKGQTESTLDVRKSVYGEQEAERRGSAWSDDVLKSLEQVKMPEDGDVEEGAEPPTVKLNRNDVLATPVSRYEIRGRERGRSPAKNLLSRFAQAQTGGKAWAKNVIGDLKRSLSRDSMRKGARAGKEAGRSTIEEASRAPTASTVQVNSNERGGVCTLRAVVAPSTDDIAHITSNGTVRRGSANTDSSNDNADSVRTVSGNEGHIYIHPARSSIELPITDNETWQAHLSHDLAMPRRAKKHILDSHTRSEAQLPLKTRAGDSDVRRASSAVCLTSGLEMIPEDRRESTRRLLSSSTGPSVPVTASSASSATWVGHESGSVVNDSQWKGERLASIVSDSDFDVDHGTWKAGEVDTRETGNAEHGAKAMADEGVRKEGPVGVEIVAEAASEGTSGDGNAGDGAPGAAVPNPASQTPITKVTTPKTAAAVVETPSPKHHNNENQLERPRNPTPSSLPTFKFKPTSANKGLAQHPLSTPLLFQTPLRGAYPDRTSSLTPPAQTPTKNGIPTAFGFTFKADAQLPVAPGSAPPFGGFNRNSEKIGSKRGRDYEKESWGKEAGLRDATADPSCVWKRYLCSDGCGRMIREEVGACYCVQTSSEAEKLCHAGEKARVGPICRSTAPVVRYVDGSDDELGAQGDAKVSSEGLVTKGPECCDACMSKE